MSVFFLMILFVILSPGMFLSIPPVGSRWWMTGKMSLRAVFVHAVVFAIILWLAGRSGAEGVEGFKPNVTDSSVNWMLTAIKEAKSLDNDKIQAILKRIAVEESTLTYDKVRKATLPGLNTKEDIQNLENAIKVVKSIPPSKVEDAKVSYGLLEKKVLRELFSKFNPNTVSQEISKIRQNLPVQKDIDAISKLGQQTITSMKSGDFITTPLEAKRGASMYDSSGASIGYPSMSTQMMSTSGPSMTGSAMPRPPMPGSSMSTQMGMESVVKPSQYISYSSLLSRR